jgi:hypothetical protein
LTGRSHDAPASRKDRCASTAAHEGCGTTEREVAVSATCGITRDRAIRRSCVLKELSAFGQADPSSALRAVEPRAARDGRSRNMDDCGGHRARRIRGSDHRWSGLQVTARYAGRGRDGRQCELVPTAGRNRCERASTWKSDGSTSIRLARRPVTPTRRLPAAF